MATRKQVFIQALRDMADRLQHHPPSGTNWPTVEHVLEDLMGEGAPFVQAHHPAGLEEREWMCSVCGDGEWHRHDCPVRAMERLYADRCVQCGERIAPMRAFCEDCEEGR